MSLMTAHARQAAAGGTSMGGVWLRRSRAAVLVENVGWGECVVMRVISLICGMWCV